MDERRKHFFRLLQGDVNAGRRFGTTTMHLQLVQELRNRLKDGARPTLLTLLLHTINCEASFPSDMLYSLLSLAGDGTQLVPYPDYTLSHFEVFTRWSKAWVTRYQRLEIVSLVDTRKPDQIVGLPSWVRDWSRPSGSASNCPMLRGVWPGRVQSQVVDIENRYLYSSGGEGNSHFRFENNTLFCNIFTCDVIDYVCEHIPPATRNGLPDFFTVLKQWIFQVMAEVLPNTGDMLEHADIVANVVRDLLDACIMGLHYDGSRRVHDLTEAYESFMENDDIAALRDNEPAGSSPWHAHIAAFMAGRRLALTRHGQIVLVPLNAVEHHAVAVIQGCSVPVLIRKRPEGDGFSIVGECYFPRVMDGAVARRADDQDEWQELAFI